MSSSDGLFREVAPLHYLFKVESFSLLSKNSIVKYESNEFETGGHKWKVIFYPDGNEKEGAYDHVSLYLKLVDTTILPAGWEVNVFFRLFIFDQIRGRYLVHGDVEGRTSRFHAIKTIWGFPQFISHLKFKDASNGYLVDDTCTFGAEVFISKPTVNSERLSMVKVETTVYHTWKIENFSKIKEEKLFSDVFIAGDQNWNVLLYAKGDGTGKNNYASVFLNSPSCEKTPGQRVYADFVLCLKDQLHGKHRKKSADKHWFSGSFKSWGWDLIKLGEINDAGEGFLVKDICIIEVELTVLGVVSKLP